MVVSMQFHTSCSCSSNNFVQVAADKEPLVLGSVIISPEAAADLTGAWQRVQRKSLYNTAEEFLTLVSQVKEGCLQVCNAYSLYSKWPCSKKQLYGILRLACPA